jgi:hypothetical protein
MRAVVAALFAVSGLLVLQPPAGASPPDDIAAYCRTLHPQMPFQVRCLNVENAAAARVGRIGPGLDPEGWNRCRATSPSWSGMEQCLANAARAATGGGAAGSTGPMQRPPAPEGAPAAPTAEGAAPSPAPPPVATVPPPAAPAPAVPPSSTVILGPQPGPAQPGERNRQTRHISEEDADRQLRSVRERNPSARCTKKQYGPGWVITCE